MNDDHPYSCYTRKLPDAHILKAGEPGNCTDIAFTKKQSSANEASIS